ncbi:RNase H domain-containing protein [Hirsutella rhossiliensis]
MPSDSSQKEFLEFQALENMVPLRSAGSPATPTSQYRVLDLDATTGCPPELTIPRPLLHHLLAARTHHGDFADYHERTKASLLLPEDRAATSDEVGTSPSAAVNRAIGRDFDQFVKVAKASSFFGTICPRH